MRIVLPLSTTAASCTVTGVKTSTIKLPVNLAALLAVISRGQRVTRTNGSRTGPPVDACLSSWPPRPTPTVLQRVPQVVSAGTPARTVGGVGQRTILSSGNLISSWQGVNQRRARTSTKIGRRIPTLPTLPSTAPICTSRSAARTAPSASGRGPRTIRDPGSQSRPAAAASRRRATSGEITAVVPPKDSAALSARSAERQHCSTIRLRRSSAGARLGDAV